MYTRMLPNLFTLGNLFLGVAAILLVFNERTGLAAIMVLIAMLTDGLDGRIARALNATSEFGKELDSLSDVISFGVAPAVIIYSVSLQEIPSETLAWIGTAMLPICGALRLARFNVMPSAPGYFIGLPIPAAGGVIATLALFSKQLSPAIMLITTIFVSLLMVSTVRYPNFKKVGIPRHAIWVVPIIIAVAITLGLVFPEHLSKILFVPLVGYALYGVKKSIERKLGKQAMTLDADEEDEEEVHDHR